MAPSWWHLALYLFFFYVKSRLLLPRLVFYKTIGPDVGLLHYCESALGAGTQVLSALDYHSSLAEIKNPLIYFGVEWKRVPSV